MEQSPELPARAASNLFTSQPVYISVSSIVLLLAVAQSFQKDLKYVRSERCMAPA